MTTKIDRDLSKRISKLTEKINKLSKRVNKRYAKLEEMELRQTLRDLCFNRGFIARGKPAVDVIITGRKTVALVEIAMRGGSKDIRQLLMASKAYEEIYNVKPNILFLLCVEEPDELTVKRAEKKGVVVTMRPGEIVRTMEKIEKSS